MMTSDINFKEAVDKIIDEDNNYENVTEECFTSTKSYYNFPCAHRQYRHEGNCHLIHGYSRSFHFVFGIKTFSKEGFAVDYGDLDELKAHLDYMYDHTLVVDEEDPYMDTFKELEKPRKSVPP